MARIDANVVAIDPSEALINVARDHLNFYSYNSDFIKRITYSVEAVEDHAKNNTKYDAVVISEVLEINPADHLSFHMRTFCIDLH